jgi:hypothetical protein
VRDCPRLFRAGHGADLPIAEDGQRTLTVAPICCLSESVKQHGQWLFAERRPMINWTGTGPSAP